MLDSVFRCSTCMRIMIIHVLLFPSIMIVASKEELMKHFQSHLVTVGTTA